MKRLLTRVVTALVLVIILLVVFFRLPPAAAAGLLTVFTVAAAWEWGGFVSANATPWRIGFAVTVALIIGLLGLANPEKIPVMPILYAALLWWCLALVLVLRFPVSLPTAWRLPCGLLVLVPAWVAMLTVLRSPSGGPELLLLALAVVWAADVGAYFTGRQFGRTRLAPRVSPGKTWEGVGGGLVATALVATAGAALLQLPAPGLVLISVAAAAISIIGDLTVSIFKRTVGLKDSGSLFPGHGGVLDRIDSLTAAMPLFVVCAVWLGYLQL
ncbi:MAG: phosphatidate cytidylyltransferase [Chromatiales bacterium]|nr:MAG: phosphatidate cytidylyltransferase [Chromatiales bacterium]